MGFRTLRRRAPRSEASAKLEAFRGGGGPHSLGGSGGGFLGGSGGGEGGAGGSGRTLSFASKSLIPGNFVKSTFQFVFRLYLRRRMTRNVYRSFIVNPVSVEARSLIISSVQTS